MKNKESEIKLRLKTNLDDDGFPIDCQCPDCKSEYCGALVFQCKEYIPDVGIAMVIMSVPQFNALCGKFTDATIFETPDGYYTHASRAVICALKVPKEAKNHHSI